MLFPSMSILIMSAVALALLVAVDWYVWGATFASDRRFPKQTAAPAQNVTVRQQDHEDAGFKHVA
jgi:hypothetical protein